MPSLLSNVTWVDQVMDVVENSLMDERVEVRSKAGQVLSGLLHCAFVDKPRHDSLLVSIKAKGQMKGTQFSLLCHLGCVRSKGYKSWLQRKGYQHHSKGSGHTLGGFKATILDPSSFLKRL